MELPVTCGFFLPGFKSRTLWNYGIFLGPHQQNFFFFFFSQTIGLQEKNPAPN